MKTTISSFKINRIVIKSLDPSLKKWKSIIIATINLINNNKFNFKISKLNILLSTNSKDNLKYYNNKIYLSLVDKSPDSEVIYQLSQGLMFHLICSFAPIFFNHKEQSQTNKIAAIAFSFVILKKSHHTKYLNNKLESLNNNKSRHSQWKYEINEKYKNWKGLVKEINLAVKNEKEWYTMKKNKRSEDFFINLTTHKEMVKISENIFTNGDIIRLYLYVKKVEFNKSSQKVGGLITLKINNTKRGIFHLEKAYGYTYAVNIYNKILQGKKQVFSQIVDDTLTFIYYSTKDRKKIELFEISKDYELKKNIIKRKRKKILEGINKLFAVNIVALMVNIIFNIILFLTK